MIIDMATSISDEREYLEKVRPLSMNHRWARLDQNESSLIASLTRYKENESGWVRGIEVD